MATLRLDAFGGIAPLIDPRKLRPTAAVQALDCKFDGTDMRPLQAHVQVETLGFNISRLFKYRFAGQSRWLAWNDPWVVDPVPSPIAQDALGRLYWSRVNPATTGNPANDNYPRAASQPQQSDIANNTSVVRRLGVPQPTLAPTFTETRAAFTVQPVTMSRTSPVRVTTALDHPFKEGQRVIVKFAGTPAARTNMSELNGLDFVVSNVAARAFDLRGSDGANYSPLTDASQVTIERVYAESDNESRSYVYTWVTDWGEEGAPSPPSAVQDVRYDSSVTLTVSRQPPSWASGSVNRVRVYRAVAGDSGANFFFVAEAAIAGAGATMTVPDAVEASGLGEVLPSTTWTPPPNGLTGLRQMPNGFLVGFVGNTLHFSEPYMPHAWPDEYRKTVHDDIVAIEVFGQTLVIATRGRPYMASGTDPSSMSLQQVDADAPCINKGGMCSVGAGVMYPTPDGLALVSAAGPQVITREFVGKRQWAQLWANTMDAVFHDGRYIAFSRGGGVQTLIAEYSSATGINLSHAAVVGRAPAIDPDDDTMHFALQSGATASQRWRFEGSTAVLTGTWVSRVFSLPRAVSMGCGRVYASGYPVTLTIGYANLAGGGQPAGTIATTFDVVVLGPEPFRLPGGFLSREWQVTVKSAAAVQAVFISDSMDELREQS